MDRDNLTRRNRPLWLFTGLGYIDDRCACDRDKVAVRHTLGTTGAIAMSMQSVASPAISITPPKRNSLTHIPGDEGWPLIGKTLEVLADPKGHVEKHSKKYGLVYRSHLFGETSLVLLDFEEHRLHRRALSVAFKSGPMKSYLGELDTGIAARVAQWKAQPGPMLLYPAMKQLTLDLAATSFLGAGIGPEDDEITRAFVDMVAATIGEMRKPQPGTAK